MHYYKFNIGDYRKDTGHLSTIEHGIYRQLIDWYYLDEKPIPAETQVVMRRLSLGSDALHLLQNVLSDFFNLTENGYIHNRVEAELNEYKTQFAKNRVNGKSGGRPRKTQVVLENNPSETQVKPKHNPNQEPLTINQEPLTNDIKNIVDSDAVNCPHQDILKLYADILPMLMQVKIWSDKRKRLLKSRWCEDVKRQNIDWWHKFFTFIAKSDFLTGKATDWQADIEWILNSANFIKILEGKYENKNG